MKFIVPRAASFSELTGTISDAQHDARTGPAAAHEMADVTGEITDAQHGVRALANAHAFAQISGVLAHSSLGSVTASQHHNRTEAKASAGTTRQESVSWTVAFGATPIVLACCFQAAAPATGHITVVRIRSTTAATVENDPGNALNVPKMVIAMEET